MALDWVAKILLSGFQAEENFQKLLLIILQMSMLKFFEKTIVITLKNIIQLYYCAIILYNLEKF